MAIKLVLSCLFMLNCDSNLLSTLYLLYALATDERLVQKYTTGSDSEIQSRQIGSFSLLSKQALKLLRTSTFSSDYFCEISWTFSPFNPLQDPCSSQRESSYHARSWHVGAVQERARAPWPLPAISQKWSTLGFDRNANDEGDFDQLRCRNCCWDRHQV